LQPSYNPLFDYFNELISAIFDGFSSSPYSVKFGYFGKVGIIVINNFVLGFFQCHIHILGEHIAVSIHLNEIYLYLKLNACRIRTFEIHLRSSAKTSFVRARHLTYAFFCEFALGIELLAGLGRARVWDVR